MIISGENFPFSFFSIFLAVDSSVETREALTTALALVITLETDPEKWRELQHLHISSFPKMRCLKCASLLCFRCGEPTWHEGMTCKEYLQVKLAVVSNTELSETIAWTLANGYQTFLSFLSSFLSFFLLLLQVLTPR